MTALAGLWTLSTAVDCPVRIDTLIGAQRAYGRGQPDIASSGPLSFGRLFYPVLEEDAFDQGVSRDDAGAPVMVADARIDNRTEILAALALAPDAPLSDAAVFALAVQHWGEVALEHVVGDYAAAWWSQKERRLTLVRDPAGQRPLHYHAGQGFFAFASMPAALQHAIPGGGALDLAYLAGFVADMPREDGRTAFAGVSRVLPGHVLTIEQTAGGFDIRSRPHWHRPARTLRLARDEDYEAALRSLLDAAVSSRTRGSAARIASHLSGGLDSGAVSATAARLDPARDVVAFTAVPRAGFVGPVAQGRIGDERAYARSVADLYPNIHHQLVARGDTTPLDRLTADSRLFQEPIGHPCNHVWWSLAGEGARAAGARVLLTGEAGNLSLSAGAVSLLADMVRTGAWGRWLSEARGLVRRGTMRWQGVLFTSFAPWLPMPLWRRLSRLSGGHSGESEGAGLLSPEWRAALGDAVAARARGGRPEGNNAAFRFRLLSEMDSGVYRKGALALWGLDERDPTTDRRLTEFALALPIEQLLRNGENRRLARRALTDRLPAALLAETRRGYQFPDWYEGLSRERLMAESAVLKTSPAASALLDFDRIDRLIQAWPTAGWADGAVLSTYRIGLLRALSAAHFAAAFETRATSAP